MGNETGGAEFGALDPNVLAESLALIARLPLTDAEKTDAVRRLLLGGGRAPDAPVLRAEERKGRYSVPRRKRPPSARVAYGGTASRRCVTASTT